MDTNKLMTQFLTTFYPDILGNFWVNILIVTMLPYRYDIYVKYLFIYLFIYLHSFHPKKCQKWRGLAQQSTAPA